MNNDKPQRAQPVVDRSASLDTSQSADFTLAAIARLCRQLGRPERQYPVVHIAGTKGKGSTAAMLAAMLNGLGYRTGLYTSPFLLSPREEIQVNGDWINRSDYERIRHRIDDVGSEEASWFDRQTAAALLHFAETNVDIAVVEAGIGGRDDSTNIVQPVLSIITPISLDHTHLLGATVAEIAAHKAGIIKPATPVVVAQQPAAAKAALVATTISQRAELIDVASRIAVTQVAQVGNDGQRVGLMVDNLRHDVTLSLRGKHQAANLAVALTALLSLPGIDVGGDRLESGLRTLATLRLPGRFEVRSESEGDPCIVLDSAHNKAAAAQLVSTWRDVLQDRRAVLLMNVARDKDVWSILEPLAPLANDVVVCGGSHPRLYDVEQLAALARQVFAGTVYVERQAASGLATAKQLAQEHEAAVLVTGSGYFLRDIYKLDVSP